MNTVTKYIRNHLHEICGLDFTQPLDECVREQCTWSANFMKLMIHRITFGRYRYGKKDVPVRKNYNNMRSAMDRMLKYESDGNLEHLIDIANLCMLEFELGQHPKRHFKAVDDGQHVEEINDTNISNNHR